MNIVTCPKCGLRGELMHVGGVRGLLPPLDASSNAGASFACPDREDGKMLECADMLKAFWVVEKRLLGRA